MPGRAQQRLRQGPPIIAAVYARKSIATWLLGALLLAGCATTQCPGVTGAMREPLTTWDRVAAWSPPGVGVAVALLAVPMFVAIPIACRAEHARARRAAETPAATAIEQPADTEGGAR